VEGRRGDRVDELLINLLTDFLGSGTEISIGRPKASCLKDLSIKSTFRYTFRKSCGSKISESS
jgi:hypothetical protein